VNKIVDENPDDFLTHDGIHSLANTAGGFTQKWKQETKVGQDMLTDQPQLGEETVKQTYDLKQINRLDFPIHLNPQIATFNDVGIHGLLRHRLSPSTVEKNLRYARFMETHTVPVNFRDPTYENFIRHMDYREQIEHATPDALKHEWKTMQMFLFAYGIHYGLGTEWDYNPPAARRPRKRMLPLPETVNKFFTYNYSQDEYENALYQYLFFHSFLIGWRVPSEIVTMKTSDVKLDASIPHLIITEPKKRSNTRTLFDIEQAILTSPVHKSLKNWLDHWRPKVANQYSEDALYLWPTGKPVTLRLLGHQLSIQGKKIWKEFRPYDMRHWCAVARLTKVKIETKNFDIYPIQKWLGHENSQTTGIYVDQATSYFNVLPVDWISLALKPSQMMAGKRDKKKTDRVPFLDLLPEIPPRERDGPGEI